MPHSFENKAAAAALTAAVLAPQVVQPNVLHETVQVRPEHVATAPAALGETGLHGTVDDFGPNVHETITRQGDEEVKTMTVAEPENFAAQFTLSGPAALEPSAEQTNQFRFDVTKGLRNEGYTLTSATEQGETSDDSLISADDQATAGFDVADKGNEETANVRGENAARVNGPILNELAGAEVPMTQKPGVEVARGLGQKVQALAHEFHTTPNQMVSDFNAGKPLPREVEETLAPIVNDRGAVTEVTGTRVLQEPEAVAPTVQNVAVTEGSKTPLELYRKGVMPTQSGAAATTPPAPKVPKQPQPDKNVVNTGYTPASPQNVPPTSRRITQPRAYNGARYGRTDRTRRGA